MNEEITKLISDAKNVCLIPQDADPESLSASLALFYTLKELGKNVNLLAEKFLDRLNFLVPSLDFISWPKNFVLSVPRSVADISQIYYEKNEEALKIHLTIDKGNVTKEDIAFYFSDAKPDLAITVGIKNFEKELSGRLNSFGFILDTPIINIDSLSSPGDNTQENTKFGKVNLVETKSISEVVLSVIESLSPSIKKPAADAILAGLIIRYEDFKRGAHHEIFKTVSRLVEHGADYYGVSSELNKTTEREMQFLTRIFQGLRLENNGTMVSTLATSEFHDFSEIEAHFAVKKIKTMGVEHDLLVLWKSHSSPEMTRGFFYSKKPELITKVSGKGIHQKDWVFLSLNEADVDLAKNQVITLLS